MTTDNLLTLQKLGLSPAAAQCYDILATRLPHEMAAADIVQHSGLSRAAVYRALQELHLKGFITKSRIIKATRYRAEPLSSALENYTLYLRTVALPLIKAQQSLANITPVGYTK